MSPRRRCAFLSIADLTGWVVDDDLCVEPLARLGWDVERVPWRGETQWSRFDAVVIRSTWDYQHHTPAFLDVLREIADAGIPLANSIALVEWNLRKTYLGALADAGVGVVPTMFAKGLQRDALDVAFERFRTDELVVKPVVGATAGDTFRVPRQDAERLSTELRPLFVDRGLIIQPFVRTILEDGELSVIAFDGRPSHAVRKRPKPGDFRVQEEHGGIIERVPITPELDELTRRSLLPLPDLPLYARIDVVSLEDRFAIMELEVIEPSLYLRCDPRAPEMFADAIDTWWTRTHRSPR